MDKVQTAAHLVTRAAEHGGPMIFARDSGERSKANRAFPILTILHAALRVSSRLGDQRQDAVGDADSNDM